MKTLTFVQQLWQVSYLKPFRQYILYFLQTVNPNNTFAARIKASLAKYPQINVSVMGYWEKNSLWE